MNHQRASIWLGLSFWVTPVSFAAVFYFCGLVTSEDRPSGEHFPIDQYGYISIPVQLFGEKLNFCLDTGHSETQFHPDLRDQLGPKSKEKEVVTGVGNKVLEFFEHPELLIGDKSPETFRTTDLAICARSGSGYSDFWRRYNGLLGMSYLRSKVLHIKFDESFAEFLVPALNDESHTERMRFSNSVAHILLRVSDEGFQSFAIDTGAGTNVGLSHDLFRILVNKRKISLAPSIEITTSINTGTTRSGILDSLELGPYRFTNVSVLEMPVNLLGMRFLSRFDLELDFPNRIAQFKPGRRIDIQDRRYRTGFGVARVNGRTFIGETQPDGIGWNAGIRDDDDLISIDDNPIEKLTILKIRDLLCDPGVERKFVVQHDGAEHSVVLKLSNEPDPFPNEPVRRTDP